MAFTAINQDHRYQSGPPLFPTWCKRPSLHLAQILFVHVCSVMSDSVTPWTIASQSPLSWNFPVGCHFLLQEIFLTQELNPHLLQLLNWQADLLTLLPLQSYLEPLSLSPLKLQIPVELFQILKDDAVKVLHSICQQICKTQQWPQDWKRSVFIPIPKKGNPKECSNDHTIALISHNSKVMLKIFQGRLQHYMDCELPDVQAGFRKGRGTRDQIANICWIIKKATEFQKKHLFLLYWLCQSLRLCVSQ